MRNAILCIILLGTTCLAQTPDRYLLFSPNRHAIWFSNNGNQAHSPAGREGWFWPSDSRKVLGYEVDLLYAGKVNGQLQANGAYFRSGLSGGGILDGMLPADVTHPTSRIWHIVRTDSISGTNPDYNNWPSMFGAPSQFNGKPLFLGDEQIWYVSSDLDSARVASLFQSTPVGIEIQSTAWGSTESFQSDVVYVRQRLINKGPYDLKDAYMTLMEDVDLGDGRDDLAGVDTLLQLSFFYNGNATDNVFGIPPAAGMVLLQTPIADSPGDTAIAGGIRRPGFRNVRASGYYFCDECGSPVFMLPDLGTKQGADMLYNNMQGYIWNGNEFTDYTTGNPVKIPFAGDPVRETGFRDGLAMRLGPRIAMFSFGPFQLLKGDTQEVVYAYVAKRGTDRLNSIDKLKEYAGILRSFYPHQKYLHSTPMTALRMRYPELGKFTLEMDVTDSNAVGGKAVIVNIRDSLIAEFPIFDDGAHGDGASSDHHWAGEWTGPTIRDGVDVYFDMTDPEGFTYRLHGGRRVPVAGDIHIVDSHIESDHLNQDGNANPGENLRVGLEIANRTPFLFDGLVVTALDGTVPNGDTFNPDGPVPSMTTTTKQYSGWDKSSFITVQVPDAIAPGAVFRSSVWIDDNHYNRWEDSITLPVEAYLNRSSDSLIKHIAGPATGTLGIRLLRPADWKDDSYRVTVTEGYYPDGYYGLLLKVLDLSDKSVLTERAPLRDVFAHDFPTVDGFRLTAGNAVVLPIYDTGYGLQNLIQPVIEYRPATHEWLNNNAPWEFLPLFFGLGPYHEFDVRPVKIVFSATEQQKAYVYVRQGTPSYGCAGFGTVPFRAYDITDSSKPRQINIGFVEQAGGPRQDMIWDPVEMFDREYLVIFNSTYTGVVDTAYTRKRLTTDLDRLDAFWVGWYFPKDSSSRFTEGDEWYIRPTIPVSERDTFIVNMKGRATAVHSAHIPYNLVLGQNYPNPFGLGSVTGSSITTIPFAVPAYGHVRLRIYDALGRRIATLVDDSYAAGQYEFLWNAHGKPAGMYTVELEMAGTVARQKIQFMK